MKRKVAIIFGGASPEHEVSLSSAYEVLKSVDREKFEPFQIGISKEGIWYVGDNAWDEIFSKADRKHFPANLINYKDPIKEFRGVKSSGKLPLAEWFSGVSAAFIIMHGPNCEDGKIQAIFEILGIPIAGCGVLSSAICMNKNATKSVLIGNGIPVTKGISFSKEDLSRTDLEQTLERIINKYPMFAKPVSGGSSIGVTKIKSRTEIMPALRLALQYDNQVLVEEYIDHRELMVAILGPDKEGKLIMSPVGEVIPSQEIYDYADKYVLGTEVQVCPANTPPGVAEKVLEIAERAYRALHCTGMARVDCFYNKETGEVSINEVNTIPGFTGMSHYPKFMKVVGFELRELVTRLIELTLNV